jgi:Ser/Thr protein kinase RdoA (MazF antagonist)
LSDHETSPAHDLSADGDVLERVTQVAQSALDLYDLDESASVELLNVSENATFRVNIEGRPPQVLRVHRRDYHSPAAIESELDWMEALRRDTGMRTPIVIPSRDRKRVVELADPSGGPSRSVVMFEFIPGSEPANEDAKAFEQLGEITAVMHAHSRRWQRPPGFTRFTWDMDTAFGATPRWGRWQDGIGMGSSELDVLGRLEVTLRQRLEKFGTGPERFGLVHADTRLANLLIDKGTVSVIDFDDSGFSWFLYDLGTSVSFFEHQPQVPELLDAWMTGYRRTGVLTKEEEDEIWTFVLYRRLLLVAWIGSHSAERELGAPYTQQSCDLAEGYLAKFA